MVVLADHNAWSALEQLIIAVAAIGVAATGTMVTYFLRRIHQQGERTYRHLNGLEDAAAIPDGEDAPTLGRLVQEIDRTVRDGFARNDEDHGAIIRTVETQGELLHDHGRRLDAHRVELDRLHGARGTPPQAAEDPSPTPQGDQE